jgi:hypothetical protein
MSKRVKSDAKAVASPSTSGAGAEVKHAVRGSPGSARSFEIGTLLEVYADQSNTWYKAKIVDNEPANKRVRVHFVNWSKVYDEWIPLSSPRLRFIPTPAEEAAAKKQKVVVTRGGFGFYRKNDVVYAPYEDKRRCETCSSFCSRLSFLLRVKFARGHFKFCSKFALKLLIRFR